MNCLCNLLDDCDLWLWIAIIILIIHALCCDSNGSCGNNCGNVGNGCGCDCNCDCGCARC